MGRLIDCNDVYNAIQITADNFGVAKRVIEDNMITMLSKIETVEVIPKAYYNARLKADMVAMLEEISDKFDEQYYVNRHELHDDSLNVGLEQGQQIIQQKIDALKANKEEV